MPPSAGGASRAIGGGSGAKRKQSGGGGGDQADTEFDFQSQAGSEFSLSDEVKRQEQASSKRAKSNQHAVDEDAICVHCTDKRAQGQLRCWVHKRAYECIQKNSAKDPKELQAFQAIFGQNKSDLGDLEKATQCMEKFLEMYPDGKCPAGKARGNNFQVSSLVHTEGHRKEKYRGEEGKMWDFELFSNWMKLHRCWDTARSRQEWERIKADPDTDGDMGGPRHSKERLTIPAYLIGEVTRGEKHTSFEERRVDSSTKAKKISDDEMVRARAEIDRGFGAKLDVGDFEASSRLTLPASAAMSRGDGLVTPGQLLHSVFGNAGASSSSSPSSAAALLAASGGDAAAASPAAASAAANGPEGSPDKKAASLVDVRSTRNSSKKALKGTLEKLRKRVVEVILSGKKELQATQQTIKEAGLTDSEFNEFRETLQERIRVGEAWLGTSVEPPAEKGQPILHPLPMGETTPAEPAEPAAAAGAGTAVDGQEAQDQAAAENKGGERPAAQALLTATAEQHDGYLKKLLASIAFLPMESSDVNSSTNLEKVVDKVGVAIDITAVEAATELVNQTKVLIDQLIKAISIATADLRKAVNRDAADYKKKAEAEKRKRQEEEAQAQKDEEAAHQRKLMSMKVSGSFKLPLAEIGHPAMRVHADSASWLEAQKSDAATFFMEPSLLQKTTAFEKTIAGKFAQDEDTPEAKLSFALTRWSRAFPGSQEAQTTYKVVAPVLGSMGGEFCMKTLKDLLPCQISSTHPGFTAMTGKSFLYGALKDSVIFGHEPNFMATLRVQTTGTAEVLAMSAEDAQIFAKDILNKTDLSWDLYRDALKNVSETDARKSVGKAKIWHGTIEPGMTLFCPAGFTVAFASAPQDVALQTALKFSCLPNAAFNAQGKAFSAVESFKPAAADTKVIGILRDVLAVAAATAPPA